MKGNNKGRASMKDEVPEVGLLGLNRLSVTEIVWTI
jgi:hypothetical protein